MSLREDLRYLPGGCFGTFHLPEEVAFIAARGQGARIWDTDGAEYVDHVLGSGPMVVGHCHPQVVEALREQAGLGTTFYTMNDKAPRLAARICEFVPCAEAVKFVSDGTEATAYAMRFARAFTGRPLVLKFEGAYHGHHDYALQGLKAGGNDPKAPIPASAGIPASVGATIRMASYNDLESVRAVVAAEPDQLAAIIVEPVQRSIEPVEGFLQGLRDIADEIGALLIFDEVVTGFRLRMGGAQEYYGVKPDLCTMGKAIGGGLPLAAVAGRRDILDLSIPGSGEKYVYLSGTLNGNPLAAAAGLATLDVLESGDGPARIAEVGRAVIDGLTEAAHRLSIPFQMIGPEAIPEPVFSTRPIRNARDHEATDRAAARQFGIEMIRRKVFVVAGAKMYMSTAHDARAIEETCRAGYEAMKELRDRGLFRNAA